MLSIARQARGSCLHFEAKAASASSSRAGKTSGKLHTRNGLSCASLHFLRRLPGAAASTQAAITAPMSTSIIPAAIAATGTRPLPPLFFWRRDRLASEAAAATAAAAAAAAATSCASRAVSSSGNMRQTGANETGVGGDDSGVGRGGCGGGGGIAEGWEDEQLRDHQEEDVVSGLSSDLSANGVEATFLSAEDEEAGEESASDDDGEIDVGQSAAASTENSGGDEAFLSKSHTKDPSMMRLSRRIARSGIASRREAERLIEGGVVKVNGQVVQTPALNVGPGDVVKVKGKALERQEDHTPKLWMVHKTRNELVTRHDPEGRPTVFDRLARLKLPDTLMPVGRLDYNTEGLLLLTNDGDLARQMELPSSNIVRTYSVRVYGNITEEKLRAMRSGCTIDGVRYKGMFVRVEGGGGKGREGRNAWLTIECTEGKNRQIRKICRYLCLTVNRLARTRYGPFSLGKVRAGGVARVEIPKAFIRRLEDGTAAIAAAGSVGAGSRGSGRKRVGPGPGTGKRREADAVGTLSTYQAGSFPGGGGVTSGRRSGGGEGGGVERAAGGGSLAGRGASSGSRGRGAGVRGERIRKGVGAPMSRGDRTAQTRAQQRAW